jgi:hypothetical protein
MEDRMIIRSYLAWLSFLVVISGGANAWAQPSAAPFPVAGAPAAYPYQEGTFVPPGHHVELRSRKGLVWSGVAVFGAFYGLSTLAAAGKDPASPYLLVPLAGPILYASRHECPSPCDDLATGPVMFMLTAGQATGALLFALGFASPRAWIVPDATAGDGASRVSVVPRVDRSSSGLVVLGTF